MKKLRAIGLGLVLAAAGLASVTASAEWKQNSGGRYYVENGTTVVNNWLRMSNGNNGYADTQKNTDIEIQAFIEKNPRTRKQHVLARQPWNKEVRGQKQHRNGCRDTQHGMQVN